MGFLGTCSLVLRVVGRVGVVGVGVCLHVRVAETRQTNGRQEQN